jgi:diamine N-acetyltransferase
MRQIQLVPINRGNWEKVLELELEDDQRSMMPGNAYSLLQAVYEKLEPYGIYLSQGDEENPMIGFLSLGHWSGLYWIPRVMIDRQYQGLGYGREALEAALEMIRKRPDAREIRTTIDRRNAAAEYLFQELGFKRQGTIDEHEFVMACELD